jgi:transposase, IS30 family
MDGLVRVLKALPHLARRSITFDRGTEFTDWPYLQQNDEWAVQRSRYMTPS